MLVHSALTKDFNKVLVNVEIIINKDILIKRYTCSSLVMLTNVN